MKRTISFFKTIALLFLLLTIAGQRVTAETMDQIKGRVENGVYTAEDNSFSIRFPFTPGTYDESKLNIRETYIQDKGAYVSFGIDSWNQSLYRIALYRFYKNEDLNKIADKITDDYIKQIEKGYNSRMTTYKSFDTTNINQHKARHCILSQKVRFRIQSGPMKGERMDIYFKHDAYIIDYGETKVMVWVQTPIKNLSKKAKQLNETFSPELNPKTFAESLIIY